MKRIAIVTATRAEYGLLTPLIHEVTKDEDLDLDLIVTGTHLSNKFGYTINAIYEDGFPISHEISILEDDNSPYGISLTMANAIREFAKNFRDDRPDMVVILGDRTEMLGIASAAMNERIPIAHIHGGEVTEGAVDDCIRHALTKMSYLHFTATEIYRKRVVQLGENPERVFNVGALGAENILKQDLLGEKTLRAEIGIPMNMPYSVVTYHPVTLANDTIAGEIHELCTAMTYNKELFYIITAANADSGGRKANELLQDYCDKNKNAKFVYNLGMKRYLSVVKYASFVLGNSSSGILEAPVLGTPTVNVGNRQKGRLMADTVICCEARADDILQAMGKAGLTKHSKSQMFGNGTASKKMVEIIKAFLREDRIDLKKSFFDMVYQ